MTDLRWTIEPIEALERYATDWDTINRSYDDFTLMSYDFFSEAVKYLTEKPLKLAICHRKQEIVCISIIEKVCFGVSRTFQPSQSPLGAWIQSPAIPTQLLIKTLAQKLHRLPLGFSITQQDPNINSLNLSDISECKKLSYIETGSLNSVDDFDKFWESRGKNLRQNTNKAINRLNKEDEALSFKIINNKQDVDVAIDIYAQLESSGWKSDENTAITPENNQGLFYKNLFKKLADSKSVIIYQLLLGDKIIASDLTIISKGRTVILKTTYDEKFKRFSPATVLRKLQFEYIFKSENIKKIEFYGKMMDWHYRWTHETREMYHLNWLSTLGKYSKKIRGKIK